MIREHIILKSTTLFTGWSDETTWKDNWLRMIASRYTKLSRNKMTRRVRFKDVTERIINQNTNTFDQAYDEQTTDSDMRIWGRVLRHRILNKYKLQHIRHDLYLIFIQSRRYVIDVKSTKNTYHSVTRWHALSDDHVQTVRRQDSGAASESWLLSFVFLYDL